MGPTYHVELRKFPRASTRFNLTGEEVGAIVIPWVQDRVIDLDDVKWIPQVSSIAIVEGPPIALERLTMGRGWKIAQREGADVTERVLAEARRAVAGEGADAGGTPEGRAPGALETLLGAEHERLLRAWHGVAARTSGLRPSESLALAERELQDERRADEPERR